MAYINEFYIKYTLLIKWTSLLNIKDIPSKPGKKWHVGLTPSESIELNSVGRFVESLRSQYKKGALCEFKIIMLDEIDFNWVPMSIEYNRELWKKNISKLTIFRDVFGHCNVPEHWSVDIDLAIFVANMRSAYSNKKLSAFKVSVLRNLSFEFSPGKKYQKRSINGRFLNSLYQ